MTFLQGHIEIGGMFVITTSHLVGGFDETTGEFIDYSIVVEDFREGWNHVILMVQGYGSKQ